MVRHAVHYLSRKGFALEEDSVSRETRVASLAELGTPSDALRAFAGGRLDALEQFAGMTAAEGSLRGLIGPREVPKLWDRHIENSAALLVALPDIDRLIDVGSGGGFPGIVVAVLRPEIEVYLIEPMERRTTWLKEVRSELGLENVVVYRGRADEFHGSISAPVVTARAVARMDKLGAWCLPLVEPGGELIALKGSSIAQELEECGSDLRRLGAERWIAEEIAIPHGVEKTHVARVRMPVGKGTRSKRS